MTIQQPDTLRICEICGNKFIMQYGYSLTIMWMVTGFHEGIPAFQCPHTQHWGCSPEHAMQATIDCLQSDEGMSVNVLKYKHKEAESAGKRKVEDKHVSLLELKGETFHIVE